MRNFLARIAAPVLQTQAAVRPRLQPMLGSVYAPERTVHAGDAPFAAPAVQDAEAAVRSAPLLSPPAMFAMPEREAWTRAAEPLQNDVRAVDAAPLLEAAPHAASGRALHGDEMLLPGDEMLLPAVPVAGPDAVVARSAGEFPAPRESTSVEGGSGEGAATAPRPTPASMAAQPLMPPVAQAIRVAPLRAAPAVQGLRNAARSEPDEIHIHIGRIEVAAVTPPAPRAMPAPPKRSLNLEDYLRRER